MSIIVIPLVVLAVLGAVGAALTIDARRRVARDTADELEAARLRLVAAGEDPDGPAVHDRTGGTGVYVSRHAAPLDGRTAALVVDPTLSATEVATIVEHVEPGAGSLASFAATACDTREMRTAAEQRHLIEVYDQAHDEDVRHDLARALAGAAESEEAEVSRKAWAAIDAWIERYHGKEHYANCVHCAEALHEQSDEYAQLVSRVESEHTGEISKAEIEALYAARGTTV